MLGTLKGLALVDRGRGSFEEKEAEIDGVKIPAVKWLDNKAVNLATTFDSTHPLQAVKCFDPKQKFRIAVTCPRAVITYNKYMGGVDLVDGLISYDCIKIRSKKYYLQIFDNFLDMSIVTVWLLLEETNHNLEFLQKL